MGRASRFSWLFTLQANDMEYQTKTSFTMQE
jgi:hypothetical protein